MTITRRSFIGAALSVVPLSLLATTIGPQPQPVEVAPVVNTDRCDGVDCDFTTDFDSWSTMRLYAVHFWPRENPQRYQAKIVESKLDAQIWFDNRHGRGTPGTLYVTPKEFNDLLQDERFMYTMSSPLDRYHMGWLDGREVRMVKP